MAPQCSAEVLSVVAKQRKAVMCLGGEIHVLDRLCSGVSYSAVCCEFNVSESTIYIK